MNDPVKEILLEAFKFHGHKCWASTAGVSAGLAALRALGERYDCIPCSGYKE